MARGTNAVELNTFVRGLITEASPLTFPDNASLDEQNFILNRDGSRSRRPGLDLESSSSIVQSIIPPPNANQELGLSSFKWTNAGGIPTKTIIVVQIGPQINFFDSNVQPLALGYIFSYNYPNSLYSTRFSYAVVDGLLVVATGQKQIDVFTYDAANDTMIRSQKTLLVRDFFGVTDVTT